MSSRLHHPDGVASSSCKYASEDLLISCQAVDDGPKGTEGHRHRERLPADVRQGAYSSSALRHSQSKQILSNWTAYLGTDDHPQGAFNLVHPLEPSGIGRWRSSDRSSRRLWLARNHHYACLSLPLLVKCRTDNVLPGVLLTTSVSPRTHCSVRWSDHPLSLALSATPLWDVHHSTILSRLDQ